MAKRIGFFKKLRLYKEYRQALAEIKNPLYEIGYRYDWLNRAYTVLEIDEDLPKEEVVENEKFTTHLKMMFEVFNSQNLQEIMSFKFDRLGEKKYLVYWHFSLLDMATIVNNLILGGLGIIAVITLIVLLLI